MNSMNGLNEQLEKLKLKGDAEKSPKRGPPIPPKPKHPNPNSIDPSAVSARGAPIYDNVGHVNTLDNSLVLDQQLKALEYHKQALEAQKHQRNITPSPQGDNNGTRNADGLVYSNIVHARSGSSGREEKNLYSNIPYNRSTSDDFPPPPPLELNPDPSLEYSRHLSSEDELPPPPSPVSSSYSELRRAIDSGYPTMSAYAGVHPAHVEQNHGNFAGIYQNEYGAYGAISQNSSTYESIYEPINPRPASEMSSRSNYSLYTPYGGSRETSGGGGYKVGGGGHKEAEVDVLTEMLVQSLDGHADGDSFGICIKCGDRVIGENSGCTAMNQIYHIECFTCCQCQINLQGKPFYALDDKPYCEEDYLNTLEKCSVCMKPILERILRATGKPYHPGCFCCIVCGKSLDGIPFTVDATNQIHCIEDFHKKFAPRCCVCKLPIMPEPGKEETVRVVALDRSFHPSCYKCEDCGLLLSSEAEGRGCYPLDDHVLCKSCNAKRVQALTSHMSTEL